MSRRLRNDVFERLQDQLDFERAIVQAYRSGKFLTKQIAETYGVTPRTVQRIAKKWHCVRSHTDGNRVAAPLSPKHRVRLTGRVERRDKKGKSMDRSLRQLRHLVVSLMREQGRDVNHCELCDAFIRDGNWELHQTKDDNATFRDLRVVCTTCHTARDNPLLD